MAKKGKSQLFLNLIIPPKSNPKTAEVPSVADVGSSAPIYSYSERKQAKDNEELAKHFLDIIKIVSHFK